ncbi:TauD/TfdA family dioxygenase [Erwinia rhapontici]|uniref:TauD/TfdA family dioxygenase n=1 Tax=Erwinia rhapontici TaxID=55212 RepID=UPI003BA2701A
MDNDSRIVTLFGAHKPKCSDLHLNKHELQENGYQIIRGYGTDVAHFEQDLNRESAGQLHFSGRIGTICHQYSVLPESENLSEQLQCGGFHTDFMFQPEPPAYIALLCLKPDPRHPFYGLNQIVHMKAFLERLHQTFGINDQMLKEASLVYSLPGHGRVEQPMLAELNGKYVFRFHEKLLDKEQPFLSDTSGISLSGRLHCIMMDVASDISLDRGDMLILSNHHALHRRGECSIRFDTGSNTWQSREMASIRFNL